MKVESKKLPKSQIELEFELTAEEFKEHMAHAVEHMAHHVKVDGFRPGKAPASMVEGKIKPEALLMEAGDHAVQHVYVDYIKSSKLEPVGNPEVSIVKMPARPNASAFGGAQTPSAQSLAGNEADGAFVFKAVITVLPDVELPNYKEIAKTVKGKDITVTEDEIQESINYLQRTRAKFTAKNPSTDSGQVIAEKKDFVEIKYKLISKAAPQDGASLDPLGREVDDKFVLGEGGFMNGFEEAIIGMKAGEEKEINVKFPATSPLGRSSATGEARKDLAGKDAAFKVKVVSVQKMEIPELNDDFAKQIGSFDTLVALKGSMKEGIIIEKTEAEKQRKRGEILEKIAEKAKFSPYGGSPEGRELPEVIIEQEQQRLLQDLKNKIQQVFSAQGGPASGWEEYLASIKQTEEQIKETYKKEAEKRLRGFLVLRELGKLENIEVSDKEVEEEVTKSIKSYSQEQLKQIDINELKEYTKGVIHNEKIFSILEKIS